MSFLFSVLRTNVSDTSSTPILVQPTDITRTYYTKCRLCSVPEDEQVMFETCRDHQSLINCIESASGWFHCTDVLRYTVNKTLRVCFHALEVNIYSFCTRNREQWGEGFCGTVLAPTPQMKVETVLFFHVYSLLCTTKVVV
jgi:hypothetical protein